MHYLKKKTSNKVQRSQLPT